MTPKNYLIYFLQTFGILLMVLGHSFYQTQDDSLLVDWIYEFHMPLFFFISGYLLFYTHDARGMVVSDLSVDYKKRFIRKKAKRMLVPYFILSSLVFLPKAMLSEISKRPLEDAGLGSYIDMLIHPYNNVIGTFWFLPTIFLIFALAMMIAKPLHKYSLPITIKLIILNILIPFEEFRFLNIGGTIFYFLFFSLGYWFCQYNIEKKLERHSVHILLVTFALSILFLFVPYSQTMRIISSLSGILMSISLGQLYIRGKCRFLNHLHGATCAIFILSWFPQVASQQFLLAVIPFPWIITTPLAFATGVYVPLVIYKWIKGNDNVASKVLSFITGI